MIVITEKPSDKPFVSDVLADRYGEKQSVSLLARVARMLRQKYQKLRG